jgi:apolipoprotein N-acyltransferase
LLWRAIYGQDGRQSLKLGFFYGAALSMVSVNWLAEVMSGYGGLGPFGGTMVLVVLAAYLSVFSAMWALLASPLTTQKPVLDGRLIVPALWAAVLWTGFDQLKNLLLTGFNWTPLAGPLAQAPSLLGAADLIGVYGLGILVAWASLLLAQALSDLRRFPLASVLRALSALAIIAFQVFYGQRAYSLAEAAYNQAPVKRVSVIQPSISQDLKWDPKFREDVLRRIDTLITEAQEREPWLIVWPETSAPFLYGIDQAETAWLDEKIAEASKKGVSMLIGAAALDYDDYGYRLVKNRAWLVGPEGNASGYDKTHLVPFGEYIPLADTLPFLKIPFVRGILGAAGNYSPGLRRDNVVLGGLPFGVLICFESIFPYQARERAQKGAAFLIVTTNDGWFGESSAPEQHLAQAAMRAVETRLPVLRAANNGISALISPAGVVLARSQHNEIASFNWAMGISKAPAQTFFVRYGYYLAPICGAISGFLTFLSLGSWLKGFRSRRREAKKRAERPKP